MTERRGCFKRLMQIVIDNSESDIWEEAREEWMITGTFETETQCLCGQKPIIYTTRITNKMNNNVLYPIGSVCIKKFFPRKMYKQLLEINKKKRKEKKERNERIKEIQSWDYEDIIFNDGRRASFISCLYKPKLIHLVLNVREPHKTDFRKNMLYDKLKAYLTYKLYNQVIF